MTPPESLSPPPDSPLRPPVILLAGPTASGKTALAMALCDRLPLEIVSVDSAQVFRDMNLGTAKPDADTLARYPHHLIDLIDPTEAYSAGRFCRDAAAAITAISARGKVPLLVGGTMLYFKALTDGLADLPDADPALRRQIEDEATRRGWPALHAELAQRDPAAAARIDPNHAHRIQRALELVRLSGQTLDALFAAGQARAAAPWRFHKLALIPGARAELHQRIAQRFDRMLADGLIDEVRQLRGKYALTPALPSMRCVGYRQAWSHLDGELDAKALRETGIAATRQLAKRQLTWLRSMTDYAAIDPLQASALDDCLRRVGPAIATR